MKYQDRSETRAKGERACHSSLGFERGFIEYFKKSYVVVDVNQQMKALYSPRGRSASSLAHSISGSHYSVEKAFVPYYVCRVLPEDKVSTCEMRACYVKANVFSPSIAADASVIHSEGKRDRRRQWYMELGYVQAVSCTHRIHRREETKSERCHS